MRAAATLVFVSTFVLSSLVSCTALTGANDLEVEDLPKSAPKRDTSPTKPEPQGSDGTIGSSSGSTSSGSTSSSSTSSSSTSSSSTSSSSGASAYDAGAPGSSSPKNPVFCDGFECSGATPYCCQRPNARAQCIGADDLCDGVRVSCGNQDDCSTGEVCCALGAARVARCTKASECVLPDRVLCLADSDCPGGATCSEVDRTYDHPVCVGR